jgi:hypothetical protein
MYAPYIKQEEPLKTECQHFVDCIKFGGTPISCGTRGTELVRILEASSESLKKGGSPVVFGKAQNVVSLAPYANGHTNGNGNGARPARAKNSGRLRGTVLN